MSVAYVKSGDVLAEYMKIRSSGGDRDGGPLVYLTQFLEATEGRARLVLGTASAHALPPIEDGATRLKGVAGGGSARRSLRIFAALLHARPKTIVCGERNLPLLATLLAAKLTGARTIFSSHNTLEPASSRLRHRLMVRLNAFCLRRMHACICHGPFLTRQMAEIRGGDAGILTFDRGMDDLPEPSYAPPAEQPRSVLFVGRVEREKGVFDLLRAMRPLLEHDPDLRLVYVGDGPALEELRAEVAALGLGARVELAGRVPHREIAARLETAWVAATPTRSTFPEGRPMAATEALHFGIPVIAPDLGPFAFFVKHGENGLLFRPDCESELHERLEAVLSDPGLRARLSEGARRTPSRMAGHDDFAGALAKALRLVEGGRPEARA
jgi:glycosyltransferase involved in cell wall biosynthesis